MGPIGHTRRALKVHLSRIMMVAERGWLKTSREGTELRVRLGGDWDLSLGADLHALLRGLAPPAGLAVVLDLSAVSRLDTAGALALKRALERLRAQGSEVRLAGARAAHAALVGRLASYDPAPAPPLPKRNVAVVVVERLGRAALDIAEEAGAFLSFYGESTLTFARALRAPRRLRFTSLVSHMEQTGFNAIPIVALLSFLVGVVLAYQGADQLRRFGADIFVVNLVGISMLREVAGLMTAIIVAGRSGSAFTAQIGTMRVNQEVDAMRAMGLDPIEILVLPRVMALVVVLPLLTFIAGMMGLLGGAVMATVALEMSVPQFLVRLNDAVPIWSFWIGLVKAPVFAFLIGMVGCFQGLRVEGSAESVGRLTTVAVVHGIFLVIVADALFSILFSFLGV